jgi:hypothetical protein
MDSSFGGNHPKSRAVQPLLLPDQDPNGVSKLAIVETSMIQDEGRTYTPMRRACHLSVSPDISQGWKEMKPGLADHVHDFSEICTGIDLSRRLNPKEGILSDERDRTWRSASPAGRG